MWEETGGEIKQINWEKISISNDFLFGRVMRNSEICKEFIETILGVNIDSIQYLEE